MSHWTSGRVLAAAALATWSKTAVAGPAVAGTVDPTTPTTTAPPTTTTTAPAPNPPACPPEGPYADVGLSTDSYVVAAAFSYKSVSAERCFPGTLSLQASADGSHWKTLGSAQSTTPERSSTGSWARVSEPCLPGTWWYRGYFVSDDRAFKGVLPETTTQVPCP